MKNSSTNNCAIHKEGALLADEFRKEVCRDLLVKHRYEGKSYCVLHLPDENKSQNTDFISVVEERINNKQNNFSYIFVPDNQAFYKKKLSGVVKFSWATFMDEAPFGGVIFEDKVDFIHTVFEQGADFDKAIFKEEVCFNYAEFKGGGFFSQSQFNKKVKFWNTNFLNKCFFHEAEFLQDVNFGNAKFLSDAHFYKTTFHENADFALCEFDRYAYFSGANFKEGGNFVDASFNDKSFFYRTLFKESVDFGKVKFTENSQADFHETLFKGKVYFSKAIIEGYMEFTGATHQKVFLGNDEWLDLQQARVEKAKRISFKNVRLRPSWFTNVDLRDFIFLDVDWENADGSNKNTNIELEELQKREITGRPHRLLTITCRQLAINYEDHNHFEQASSFRRMAMDLAFWEKYLGLKAWLLYPIVLFGVYGESRLRFKNRWENVYKRWKQKYRNPISFWQSIDPPHYLYRWLSFYGESWSQAFLVLLLIVLAIFPFIYTQTTFQICPKEKPVAISVNEGSCKIDGLGFDEAIAHSLTTATLQNVDYRKVTTIGGEIWIILEKIFAPLQAALLALAIRRKFMR